MGVWKSLSESFDKDSSSSSFAEQEKWKSKSSGMGLEKVGSWIRGSLIGAGAFGKVNLALNRENGDLFAVKSIECNERTMSEMQAMENEVQILQCLDSPYVVKCLGSSLSVENGKSIRNVFIEYMPGGSLADLMKKFGGHFDEPLIRNYTRNILEGIQYLHSKEILHCDIKGQNVLVGSSGVKLADFGGARRVGDGKIGSLNSSLPSIRGTPLWMAPEVVRQVDQGPASDIWSLGCTVVEMATGKAPWSDIASAANPFVALYHIGCTEEVPDLPSCLSEEGQDFLTKCFQRDPRKRWTAEQLLQHPFITNHFSEQESEPSSKPAALQNSSSPTSAFDFPSNSDDTGYTSSIVNSVPILRSPLFAKRDLNSQAEDAPKESTSGTDFWCNSPLSPLAGEWIVVRSPKATSTSSAPANEELSTPTVSSKVEVPSISEDLSSVTSQEEEVVVSESGVAPSATIEVEEDLRMAVDDENAAENNAEPDTSCSGEHECAGCSKNLDDGIAITTRGQRRGIEAAAGHRSSKARLSWKVKKSLRKLEDWLGDSRCMDTQGKRRSLKFESMRATIRELALERPLEFASMRSTLRELALAHRKMAFRGRQNLLRGLTMGKESHELLLQRVASS